MDDATKQRIKLQALLLRLQFACARLGWDTDAWGKGIEVLERKFGVHIYLSSFKPQGMVEGEFPTAQITITPTEVI